MQLRARRLRRRSDAISVMRQRLRRLGPALWACALSATVALPGVAHAARIQVRARTTLVVQLAGEGSDVVVRGALRDQRGQPVPAVAIAVHIVSDGSHLTPQTVYTANDGGWVARAPRADFGAGTLLHAEASFTGDAVHGEAQAETTVDLARAQPVLTLRHPQRRWTTAADAYVVELTADVRGMAVPGLALYVTIDDRPVATLSTDAQGQTKLSVPVAVIGARGLHRVRAASAATVLRNASELQWPLELFAAIDVTFAVTAGDDTTAACPVGDWCVRGQATLHELGKTVGLARAVVQLYAERQAIGTLTTGDDGTYAGVIHPSALAAFAGRQSVQLVAHVAANQPWTEAGWSDIVDVTLPQPGWWLEAGSVACLLLAVLLLVVRAVRRRRSDAALELQEEATLAGLPSTTLVEGALQGAPCFGLRAQVLHGEHGRPLPCSAVLTHADGAHTLLDGSMGLLVVDALAPGNYRLSIQGDEHQPLVLDVEVPHNGRLVGCKLLPRSCRAVVRGSFALAVRRHTGLAVDWARETPRQTEPRWAGQLRRGRNEVRHAVRAVEAALYGRKTDTTKIAQAESALARVDEAQK